jgi:toxin ParE1/3/4
MMAAYNLRHRASIDIDEIADYIAQRNVGAGRRFITAVRRELEFLAEFPNVGAVRVATSRRLKGLRSWPIKKFRNYLIFYLVHPDHIEVLRVLHGARNLEKLIGEMG